MNNVKKTLIPLLGGILWVAGLIFLTPLILATNNRIAKKIDISQYENKGNSVVFAFDKIAFSQNLFRDVTVSGWAFIEHEGKNPNKKMSLILSSEENSYAFEMTVYDRIDLNTAPILTIYTIPKYRNGFEGTVSPLSMKNGIYRLFIYIQENEQIDGIINTGKEFIKHFGSFTEYAGGEEIYTVQEVPNSQVNVSSDFRCSIVNSKVLVNGWAFVDSGDLKEVPEKPIIKLLRPDGKVTYFSTVPVSRADVANTFDTKSLLLSGFSSEITVESLGEGENCFTIVFDGLGQSYNSCTLSWP